MLVFLLSEQAYFFDRPVFFYNGYVKENSLLLAER